MDTTDHLQQQDRATASASDQEFLIFTLGEQEYGIDILKVQEIRGFEPETVTRIVNSPAFIKGVINLRGVIIPIVDLRMKFGMGDVGYAQETVVIILALDSRVVGIVVDGVSDVQMLGAEQVSAAPSFGSAFSSEYLSGLGTIEGRTVILLDIERLMGSDEMQLVDSAGA